MDRPVFDAARSRAEAPCELRVHGVGGDSPHVVLGLPYPEQVAAAWTTYGGRSAVLRRGGDTAVRVFSWGELTSGSRWFALWTLLLPFTLANVAGWAEPSGLARWRSAAVRALVAVLAQLLSAATFLWLSVAGVARLTVAGGVTAAAVAMVILVATSTCVAKRFEGYRPSSWPARPRRRPWHGGDTDLRDATFFDGATTHKRGWWQHLVVIVAVGVVVFIVAWPGRDEATVLENLGWVTLAITVAQLGLVIALAALSFCCRIGAGDWRWSAPAVFAGAAVLLTSGVVSGGLATMAGGPGNLPAGPAFLLLDVYAGAAAAGLVALAAVAVVVLSRPAPAERTDAGLPGHEQLLRSGKARLSARLAQLGRHADLPLSVLVAAFAVAGLVVAAVRVDASPSTWRPEGNLLTRASIGFLGIFFGVTVRNVRRNAFNLQARRRIGQIWDVLTFWPRSFHPLAVRPYAERAVPELQEYLFTGTHADPPDRWVVTAHSQGSVLAYAALGSAVSSPPTAAAAIPPVDLLTFGSPLLSLYAKTFPRYFRREDFHELAAALAAGGGSWVNVFRATDPVGQLVFAGAWGDRDRQADVALEDPTTRPPVPDPRAPDLEEDLPVDGRVWGHSGYRRARPFKERVYQRLSRAGEETDDE